MLRKLAGSFYNVKVLKLQIICPQFANSDSHLSEIAIVLMARMYHVHVAVMQDKFYWTTKQDHDVASCKIILGWKGNLNFIDMKWKESQEVPVYNLQSAKYPPANIDAPESPGCKIIPREPSPEKEQWYNLRSNKNNPPNPPVKGDDPAKGDDPPSPPSPQQQDATKKIIGTVTFRSIHLKQTNRTQKDLKCPVCKKFTFITQKGLNSHLTSKHPKVQFKCRHCPETYKMYNGCYKHQQKHAEKKHICEMCQKGFMYPQGLELHKKTHTKVGLIPCTNCPWRFTENRNMCSHSPRK